jgi:homocysteine S-methyltransferase
MGTELERRGVATTLPLWSAGALISAPGIVRLIHDDYIRAGADIITSNTFRTTRRTFRRTVLPDRSAELTALAVTIARESIASFPDRRVLLAGSMAPLEDCYHPELVPRDSDLCEEHGEHAGRLKDAGVDFLLIETVGTLREAIAAAHAARETGLEFAVSFLCTPEGLLYGGEPLAEAVRLVVALSPSAISLNCVSADEIGRPLAVMQSALRECHPGGDVHTGVYANVGKPGEEYGTGLRRDVNPHQYAELAREWASAGVSFIGGCCGTTPEYIRAIAGAGA